MRGLRSFVALLVILIGLGAYLYFVESKRTPGDDGEKKEKVFTVESEKIEEITIKADEKTLKNLSSSEVRATVEIIEFKEGTNTMEIHVYVPPRGVELVRVVPERVQVEVIKQSTKIGASDEQ